MDFDRDKEKEVVVVEKNTTVLVIMKDNHF